MIKSIYQKILNKLKSLSEHSNIKNGHSAINLPEPEIINDSFSMVIKEIASNSNNKTFMEIGSSSGAGSTKAFLDSLAQRVDTENIKFFCIELRSERFEKLNEFITNFAFAKAFNVSSVAIDEFPSEANVSNFYNNYSTNLNKYPLQEVLKWRRDDIEYIKRTGKNFNGIKVIKHENKIEHFDVCLIDGSEFTGYAELKYLIGSKYILLDDTEAYKCRKSFLHLKNDENYQLIEHNPNLRNGFAVFKLKSKN